MNKSIRNLIIALIILIIFSGYHLINNRASGVKVAPYDTSELENPVQTDLDGNDKLYINDKVTLVKRAEYKVYALVVSKKSYGKFSDGDIAPIDLALAWGKLTDVSYLKNISFFQSSRWYYYRYDGKSDIDLSYIASHSSNNHIIPKNKNILNILKKVKVKDKVILEGYLVDIYKGNNYTWKTSLKRSDTGGGSCEVFYTERVVYKNKMYE
ncbi:MAG: hypothetical protein LIR50_19170 [Bacillota bacterium]|nr:hypothetical protein [Bacillota bacterium]